MGKKLLRNGILRLFSALFVGILSISTIHAQLIIEAEDYSAMLGVQTEVTEDATGGVNVGWIDKGDWLEYEVNIPMSGEFKLIYRIASANGGGSVSMDVDGVTVNTSDINSTGGWQKWETLTSESSFTLDRGDVKIRLLAANGGFNLNWFGIILINPIDIDKPSTPILLSNAPTVHGGDLAWSAAIDKTSVIAGYKLFNESALLAFVRDTVFEVGGLAPNFNFNISIVAVDMAGNLSDTLKFALHTKAISWDLLWSDEFDYEGKPDAEKWFFETGGHGWGNSEAQYYTNGDNASVENGFLTIETRKEKFGTNEFTSSRMNSAAAYDFLYGRIEVKAKLPSTKGSWPAIWTLPSDWVYGGWPACGEIDIMEHSILTGYGNVFGTVHTGSYNHVDGTQRSGGIILDDVTNVFHTYAIEWYPDHIDWYVDDILIFRFDNEYNTSDEWPYDIKHHLILNIAVGGGLGGEIDFNGVWPQQMVIDYVRVYDFKLGENDTVAPQAPSDLIAIPKWSSIDFSWKTAIDNYAIEKYDVFLDGEKYAETQAMHLLIQDLVPETEYTLSVQASDYAGNFSEMVSSTVRTTPVLANEIPGFIEAEDFTIMEGVQTEITEDTGGGENVGYIDANDWMVYTVDVKEEKEYRAGFRVAAESAKGDIVLLDSEGAELVAVETPVTGGWQSWQTIVSEPFLLKTGVQTIKLTTQQGGYNLNWIEIKGKDDFVGINDAIETPLVIYPNPLIDNELTIVIPAKAVNAEIIITTTDGRILKQCSVSGATVVELNSENWSSGLYLVSLISEEKVFTQTLYKQ